MKILSNSSVSIPFPLSSNIVISEEFSQKLFGKNNPAIGKSLISDKYRKEIYTVGGAVRMPLQSHIHFDFVSVSNFRRISPGPCFGFAIVALVQRIDRSANRVKFFVGDYDLLIPDNFVCRHSVRFLPFHLPFFI
jgi:hypothetical protein